MLSRRRTASRHRRTTFAACLAVAVFTVALGTATVLSFHAPSAGAREAGVGRVAHVGRVSLLTPTSTLGSAVGDTALGLPTSYDEPLTLADPAKPGIIDTTGWDEPDPFVLVQDNRYYLFTSRSDETENMPVRSAPFFGSWGPPSDALPDLPAWATPDVMWAPDVAEFGNHFMLYFTSQRQNGTNRTKCIGDAISTNPAGPYIASPVPFICQPSLGGSIDPRVFVDSDGQPYMVWKSDQNAVVNDGPTQIWSQPLSADGMHLLGSPTAIFAPDEAWQQSIVEAPQIVLVRGTYYLFYSGGSFDKPSYAVGVARCAGPLGPCGDTTGTPLLGSNLQGWGPGEESVFTNDAGIWMLYSPWFAGVAKAGPPRPVAMAHLGFGPAGPYLAAPL